jgi:HTH-type transcriptional regulator/antitoxin HigA
MKLTTWLLRFLKPIKTKKDYEIALDVAEKYFFAKKGTREANIAEVVTILIEKYEEETFPIEAPHPIEAIKFRMEQLGMTTKQLSVILGSKSRVSEVLNHKRVLSLAMIRRLHDKLKIPAEVLIQEP